MSATVSDPPKAENGIVHFGEWGAAHEGAVRDRFPQAIVDHPAQHMTRVDLSKTPRGTCPGFNDDELLTEMSSAGGVVFGFFCDGVNGAEGVRVFEQGQSDYDGCQFHVFLLMRPLANWWGSLVRWLGPAARGEPFWPAL